MEEAVQRIAREQIDNAVDEINDAEIDRHKVVHQVRKRCKKIRGLLRSVRPRFENYFDRENAWYRDAARPLSYVRDAQSMLDTFDKLMEHFQDQIDREAFASVRQQLTDRRQQMTEDEGHLNKRLEEFLERMEEGRHRVAAWQLDKKGFKAVQGGLIKTYARGRTAMTRAYRDPSTENFHEWRKRVKYHWYHMRLLQPVWSGPIKTRCDEADELSDILGDDHDLAVLRDTLLQGTIDIGGEETGQALLGLITQRQIELRAKGKQIGARLYAEPPKQFVKRLRSYWKAWRNDAATEPQTSQTLA
jgi:CHAD domain-containing protein